MTDSDKTTPAKPQAKRRSANVTVKGRVATTFLRRGETATIARTDHVDALIDAGYLDIVD